MGLGCLMAVVMELEARLSSQAQRQTAVDEMYFLAYLARNIHSPSQWGNVFLYPSVVILL
jgi:hypothetical protein